ncbi:hypothetical protein DACRYDRAFT_24359 [Dacryopinax primogenitus]|uniref:RING-type domain-containing protein n=1 Tax=Dacryopinax primogenitus (strain DJM 731) TaxID=1858805 RepID=M5FTQ8_DACPD|nr:uncharacterized protein DACRYDRAFT_24359 [Dacryopinax primogenitus]EJT98814.1 hypothetical protein DACRYDRAFT_24359 [Dacryopinax primogenitus]
MEIEMRDSESTIEERSFDDEDFDLEVRDDCIICLEANAKHTNCPNGASHPAHATCLMQWAQSQANAGQPLTCPACRAQISPLIKVVKKAPQSPTGGRH